MHVCGGLSRFEHKCENKAFATFIAKGYIAIGFVPTMNELKLRKRINDWIANGEDPELKITDFVKASMTNLENRNEGHLAQQFRAFFFSMEKGDYVFVRDSKVQKFVIGTVLTDIEWPKLEDSSVVGYLDHPYWQSNKKDRIAIRRVNWQYLGDYDKLAKDDSNKTYLYSQRVISKIGEGQKTRNAKFDIWNNCYPMEESVLKNYHNFYRQFNSIKFDNDVEPDSKESSEEDDQIVMTNSNSHESVEEERANATIETNSVISTDTLEYVKLLSGHESRIQSLINEQNNTTKLFQTKLLALSNLIEERPLLGV